MSAASPIILLLFLPIVKALVSKVFLTSTTLTLSPCCGDAGKVRVHVPPEVSAQTVVQASIVVLLVRLLYVVSTP